MSNSQTSEPAASQAQRPNVSQSSLALQLALDPCVNFAAQQNAVTPLKELTLANEGDTEVVDIVVRLRAEPEFMLVLEHRVASLAAGAKHVAPPLNLRLAPAFLATLEERLEGLLHVEVTAQGSSVLSTDHKIAVLAYDQWGGLRVLPELLCAFVLPNHPAVAEWLRGAAALLEQWTQDPSLAGYQSNSRERVALMAAAGLGRRVLVPAL